MKIKKFVNVIFCLCFSSLFGFTAATPIQKLDLTTRYPDIPLLKRQNHNPLFSISFFVADPNTKGTIKGLNVLASPEAASQFEHLVIYQNGIEPLFDTTALHSPVTIKKGETTLSVNIPYKQGWNYIWIGASLKANADMDSKPSVELLSMTSQNKETFSVSKKTGNPVKRIGITIRKTWDDQVHTYRIPGIAQTDKGTLISVYDNRYVSTKDLPGNIDVGMSRSTDGGKSWEPMKVVMDMGAPHENNGIGDPAVLFDPATKTTWVIALWSKGNRSIAGSEPGLSPDVSGQLMLVSSKDDGLTWSAPRNITAEVKNPIWHIYFNGPGSGIVMQDGTLVFASQYWDESKKPGLPHSSIMYSKDHGKTWHSGTGVKKLTTESQVIETTPGTLMLNMRDQRGYFRSVATSTDLGKTWQEHHTSFHALPDPICMASIIKAPVKVNGQTKDVVFFSNVNRSSFEHSRKDMTIKASMDLGETWPSAHQLLLDERYGYGYSSLTQIDEKTIGILYEGKRELHFLRVPVTDIIK